MKKEYVIVVRPYTIVAQPYNQYYKCEHAGVLFIDSSLQNAFISDDVSWMKKVCNYLNATYDEHAFQIKALN